MINPQIVTLPERHTANIIAIRPAAVPPFKVACYEDEEDSLLQVYDSKDNPVTGIGYHIPSDEMLDVVAHNRRVTLYRVIITGLIVVIFYLAHIIAH